MSGLQMLLRSFGIEIDPKEATQLFETLRTEVPKFISHMAATLTDMDQRLKRIEDQLNGERTGRKLQREFDRINSSDGGSNAAD